MLEVCIDIYRVMIFCILIEIPYTSRRLTFNFIDLTYKAQCLDVRGWGWHMQVCRSIERGRGCMSGVGVAGSYMALYMCRRMWVVCYQ